MTAMTAITTRPVRLVALAVTAAALGLGACGDEGDDSADRAAYPVGAPTKAGFCAAMAKVDAPFLEAGQSASRDDNVEAAKKVTDLLNDTSKAAPSDIQDAANTRLEAIRAAADGDPSELLDEKTVDATREIKEYCAA